MAKYNSSKLLYLKNTGEGLLKRIYLLNKQSFTYGYVHSSFDMKKKYVLDFLDVTRVPFERKLVL
jgi:hypothetical protein